MKRFLTTHLLKSLFMLLGLIAFSAASYAQNQVGGKVIDEAGMGLPGVNVVEKGTTNGTITDMDGNFSVTVGNNATLVFSYIGFESQELPSANGNSIVVTLKEDAQQIDEVVVVGYGTMKKSDVSGSSISMSAADIEGFVGSGVDQVLQGKAAGVQVTANSGQPGGGMSVQIRGNSSLSVKNSQPLYVVDGVPLQVNGQSGQDVGFGDKLGLGEGTFSGLSNINPEDIESMEILKDASATAIYGSRAANGVVLITTKKGKKGKANFNYVGSYGISQQSTKLDLLNMREFAQYNNALYTESKSNMEPRKEYGDPSLLGEGTDWQDEIFRTAQMHSHQLSAAGGTDNARYYVSAGYYNQEGTMLGSEYERFTTRVNLDADLTSWLKIGTNTSFANSEDHLGLTNSEDGILSTAYRMLPDVPVRNKEGNFVSDSRQGVTPAPNPIATALSQDNILKRYDLTSNLFAEIKFMKELVLRSEYSTNNLWTNAYHYTPMADYDGYRNPNNYVRHQKNSNNYWEVKNYLTYTNTFAELHSVTAMLGQETSEYKYEYLSGESKNLDSDKYRHPFLGKDPQITSGFGSGARVSMFARLFYGYDGKYNMTYTFRRDASSNFGPQNRWGNFNSVSVSWNAHKEPFLADFFDKAYISTARLRLGWGQVGNDNIGAFKWGAYGEQHNNGLGNTFLTKQLPNEAVSWETQNSWNLGLDLSFLKDRLNLIFEAYSKVSKDMLITTVLPNYMGTSGNQSLRLEAPSGNFGEMKNNGIEITISTTNINRRGFKWTTDFQFSHNNNKLVSLSGSGSSNIPGYGQWNDQVAISTEGKPLYQFYGFKVEGIYQDYADILSSPTPDHTISRLGAWIGDIKYVDVDGDKKITEADRTIIGNPMPKFTCGLTNNFSYKGFELGIFLTASYGNDVLNYNAIRLSRMDNLYENQLSDVLDHAVLVPVDANKEYPCIVDGFNDQDGNPVEIKGWFDDPTNVVVSNPGTKVPRAITGDPANNGRISSRYIEDGSFIKIKSVSLAYNIPSKYVKMAKLQSAKVSASVTNLYTFTKYSGLDPEVGTSATSTNAIGVDNGRYPSPRIISFGLNLSF